MADTKYIVGGIQQVGIGVESLGEAVRWYAEIFGLDVPVFREAAAAQLMIPYTGQEVHKRDATLLLNLLGGSGAEIWQFTSRKAAIPYDQLMLGDIGIYSAKIKSPVIRQAFDSFYARDVAVYEGPVNSPTGELHFFLEDSYGNVIEVSEHGQWFTKRRKKHPSKTGGICGVIIGVSDVEASLTLYRDILGYSSVVYDETDVFDDFKVLPGGKERYRRVLLSSGSSVGPFSNLFGPSTIELVQALDRKPQRIFRGRFWGDCGFIHLCFDVRHMGALKARCDEAGFPFTVDSGSNFTMGSAAGRFAYIEDPDGTLIEFVETFRVPVSRNFAIDLSSRPYEKTLPKLLVRMLGMKRLPRRNGEVIFS